MNMERRVAQLEGVHRHSSVGELLDLLAASEAGEQIDWSSVSISPQLIAEFDDMPRGKIL